MARAEGGAVEAEGGREELPAEAVVLELRGERVDAGDLVLELRVVDDHPLEAERVGLAVDLGARVPSDAAQQLLAAAFRFDGSAFGSGHPVYWIYGFKTGTWWPFVPTGEKQQRDNAEEMELKAKLEPELPIEPDLSKWLALFDAPI